MGLDRRPQHLDRARIVVQVAQGAGEIVGALGAVGVSEVIVGEQLGGDGLHVQPERQPAQVIGDVGMVWRQRQRRLVGLNRTLEIAGFFAGDRQQVRSAADLVNDFKPEAVPLNMVKFP